jgi:hypothetical protein
MYKSIEVDRDQIQLPFPARVVEKSGPAFTDAVLVGPSREAVEKAAEKYLRDYSPMGYSTRIVSLPTLVGDGTWKMRMTRFSSCE